MDRFLGAPNVWKRWIFRKKATRFAVERNAVRAGGQHQACDQSGETRSREAPDQRDHKIERTRHDHGKDALTNIERFIYEGHIFEAYSFHQGGFDYYGLTSMIRCVGPML